MKRTASCSPRRRPASQSRVEYGVEEDHAKKGNDIAYILYAVTKDMSAHAEGRFQLYK